MKNPWMNLWLSEANRIGAASRGLISAETSRQQNAMVKAWTEQMTEAWMAIWFPWYQPPARRRK